MKEVSPFRRLLLIIGIVALSTGPMMIPRVAAGWGWDSTTKFTLGERAAQGPAIVYDPGIGKVIMAWIGTDTSYSVNVIQSSDMKTWTDKRTLSGTSGSASCTEPPDMVVVNNQIYLAYLQVDMTGATGSICNANHLYVIHSSDGKSWSSPPTLITSTPVCTDVQGCSSWNQMSGGSITYDTTNNRFVAAAMKVANSCNPPSGGCPDLFNLYTYTSPDGTSWAEQPFNASPPSTNVRPDIKFINGQYFLTYNSGSNGNANIETSTDLITWNVGSIPPLQSAHTFRISYNPSEALYHLTWQGTDFSNQINDAISSDGLNYPTKYVFESTQDEPSEAWNPITKTLITAWTGTDCCGGGSLNVMQYVGFNPTAGNDAIYIPPNQPQQTGTATATDTQDSYVDQVNSNSNYGTSGNLYAMNQVACHQCGTVNDLEHAYLQFSLPSLPPGAQISKATVNVYQLIAWVGGSINLQFWAASSSWSESGITWNNAPGGMTGSNVVFNGITDCKCTKSFDLTNLVKSWYNGQLANNGIWVEETVSGNPTFYWSFYSKEGSTTNPPSITVTYTYYNPAPPIIPTTMCVGQTAPIAITMQNTGISSWIPASSNPNNPYRLGSLSPPGNNNWGPSRVDLTGTVASGTQYTFSFTATAPGAPGTYSFQWKMVQDPGQYFGQPTTNVQINVVACTLSVSSNPSSVPADGVSASSITIQTVNNQASVPISLSTTLGTLSASPCTTGTGGACSITATSSSAGSATITATATGYASGSTSVTFVKPLDFNLTASPATQTVNAGSTATFAVTAFSTNGAGGNVNLSISAPAAVSCSTNPSSLSMPPSPATAALTCSSSTAGEYSVTITGTSGLKVHSTSVNLIVGLSLYFRDNFTYSSTSQMTTAGWSVSTPSQASVGGGLLTLVNNQQAGSQATWTNVPTGLGNWTIALGAEWVGQSAGTFQLNAWTAKHSYIWHADGWPSFTPQYVLYRDGQILIKVNGYTPQLNVWHTLRMDMRGSVLSLYFDGKLITTYTETDPGTTLTQFGPAAGYGSTDSFNFVEVSGFSFHDDFTYITTSAMSSAGWSISTPPGYAGYATVSGGLLTLVNDGTRAASTTWTSVPPGVADWTISAGEEWVGGSYGTLQVNAWTAQHSYVWHADGYPTYLQYILYRDGQFVRQINGYTPQLNVWHTLRIDMRGGVLSLYFDGSLITTYAETDPSTSLTQFSPAEGWKSTVSIDFIQASRIDTSRFDFGMSANSTSVSFNSGSTSSSTINLNSLTGSSGTVSLVTLVLSPGLTMTFNQPRVSVISSGTTSSKITFSSSTKGTYYVTLTASDGIQFHSTTLVVTVQ